MPVEALPPVETCDLPVVVDRHHTRLPRGNDAVSISCGAFEAAPGFGRKRVPVESCRRFHADSPYSGEVLLIAPPEGRHFSARCDRSGAKPIEPSCFAQIRRAGFDIEIQFSKRDIVHWERIMAWIAGVLIMPADAGPAETDARAPNTAAY